MTDLTRPMKITFGEMRASGIRDLLIYCSDYRCSHSIQMSADRWPDHVRLSDIEPQFVCKACGKRGADVRGLFARARIRDTTEEQYLHPHRPPRWRSHGMVEGKGHHPLYHSGYMIRPTAFDIMQQLHLTSSLAKSSSVVSGEHSQR
jgi:hypothetical protein